VLDYDKLPEGLASAQFSRRGLAGLIAWPAAEPVFVAELVSAERPACTPYLEPRVTALATGYQYLLDIGTATVQDAAADVVSLAGWSPRRGRPESSPSGKPSAAPSVRNCSCCASMWPKARRAGR